MRIRMLGSSSASERRILVGFQRRRRRMTVHLVGSESAPKGDILLTRTPAAVALEQADLSHFSLSIQEPLG